MIVQGATSKSINGRPSQYGEQSIIPGRKPLRKAVEQQIQPEKNGFRAIYSSQAKPSRNSLESQPQQSIILQQQQTQLQNTLTKNGSQVLPHSAAASVRNLSMKNCKQITIMREVIMFDERGNEPNKMQKSTTMQRGLRMSAGALNQSQQTNPLALTQSLRQLKLQQQQHNDPGGTEIKSATQENRNANSATGSINPSVLNLSFNPRFQSFHDVKPAGSIRLPKIKQLPPTFQQQQQQQLMSNSQNLQAAFSTKEKEKANKLNQVQKHNNFIDMHLDEQIVRKENTTSNNFNSIAMGQNRKSLLPIKNSSTTLVSQVPSTIDQSPYMPPKQKLTGIAALQQKQLRMFGGNSQSNNIFIGNGGNSASLQQADPPQRISKKLKKAGFVQGFACKSKAGWNHQGQKKNQDNFIIATNLNKIPNRYLFGVCDGHGQYGHDVSAFIRNRFPKILESILSRDLKCVQEEYISSCLRLSFLQLSQKLMESKIDISFSGSTFVVVLMIDDYIWCANTGDSRAILCQDSATYTDLENPEQATPPIWGCTPLSHDHKPDREDEKARIVAAGGRVDSYRDFQGKPIGPARVWMLDDDIPGLAMARSFGDLIAVSCGVVCDPEISFRQMSSKDKFIIIASDGVWEFLENKNVMMYVVPYIHQLQSEQACEQIVKGATNSWKSRDSIIDDITALCVFLNKEKKFEPSKHEQGEAEIEVSLTVKKSETQSIQDPQDDSEKQQRIVYEQQNDIDAKMNKMLPDESEVEILDNKNEGEKIKKQKKQELLDDPEIQKQKILEQIQDEEGIEEEEQLSFF